MTRIRYLILLSLVLLVSGCSARHSNSSPPETDTPKELVAILPVISAHITMPAYSEEDFVKIAEETNSVLNRLAESYKSKSLLSPKKVRKLLNKSDLESLYGILDEPSEHAKNCQSKKLAEMSTTPKVAKVIRVKVAILRPRAYIEELGEKGFTYTRKQWSGWVDVTADLFRISPPQLIATKASQSQCWGETGVNGAYVAGPVCLLVPYDTYRRSERLGLAQAAQGAIAGVLRKRTSDGWIE